MKKSSQSQAGIGKMFYALILAEHECDLGPIGLDGQRVRSVHYRDIGALVSDYPRVSQIKLLRKNLAPYHRVTREAWQRFTLIPARFAQIARDAGEVSLALRRHYTRIRQDLERLDGKVEMGLKVAWNVDAFFPYFLEFDRELKARRDQLLARRTTLTRMEQIAFGEYVDSRIQQAREAISKRVLAALPAVDVHMDEVREETMITNASLLIPKDLQPQLVQAVEQAGAALGDDYRLQLEGPWPPFSFVDRIDLHLNRT